VVVLVAVAVLAACSWGGGEVLAPTASPVAPTPVVTVSPSPQVTVAPGVEPTVDPEPEVEPDPDDTARLEELRASDAFVELAEHDRAPSGRWGALTYSQFAMAEDGALVQEWTNKPELWDSVVPDLRDQCLLAGSVPTEPLWNDEVMIPVGVGPRWNDATTQGRGHFVEVTCAYLDPVTRTLGASHDLPMK
jgi:hypothetical protein